MAFLYVLGAGLQMIGQLQAGQQEAKIQEYNASVQRQQAQAIRQQEKQDVETHRRRARKFTASQLAGIVGAGFKPTGSGLEVMIEDAMIMNMDEESIKYNARLDELNALAGADLSLVRAQQSRSSSFITAGSTLLTSVAVANKLTAK